MNMAERYIGTLQDAMLLFADKSHEKKGPLYGVPVFSKKTKKKHKKHTFIKVCEVCGKAYKGNIGLSIHKKKVHGIDGKWLQK